jgi:hypothetical protein
MFCSAEIPTEDLEGALVVPRSAIHEDNVVYTFRPDEGSDGNTGTLVAREVPILRTVGDEVLVDFAGRGSNDRLAISDATAECELQPGEFIIVSPMSRPVEGMKLRRRDESLTSLTPAEMVAQLQRPETEHRFSFLKLIPLNPPVAFLAP